MTEPDNRTPEPDPTTSWSASAEPPPPEYQRLFESFLAQTDGRSVVSVNEAAELLSISRSKFYELMARAELPVLSFDATVRVPLAWLALWVLERRRIRPAARPVTKHTAPGASTRRWCD